LGLFLSAFHPFSERNTLKLFQKLVNLLSTMPSFFLHTNRVVCSSKSPIQTSFRFHSQSLSDKNNKTRDKVLVLSGPTAAGKSRIAFKLAEVLNGEIINADSVKVYRGVEIGANKEIFADNKITKGISYHLVDVVATTTVFSVGDFYTHARRITAEILARGRVPIVVGGTPFYLRWYLRGPQESPKRDPIRHAQIVEELIRENDWEKSLSRLRAVDPVYAATISSHNYRRLARALEIVSQTGAPLSNRHQTPPIPQQLDYDFRCFALVPTPRELLFRQIDERSEQLVARGLLREVGELLLARALLPQHPLTTAIGYRHALQLYASPPITSQLFLHFVSTMQSATRQLAVQQLKWLRHEPTFQWLRLPLNAQGSEESAINQMLQYFSLSEDEYHERRAREEHVSEQNTLKTLSAEEMRRQCRYRPFLKVFCHEEKVHEQVAIASEYVARLSRHGALQPSLFSQGQQTQSPPTASLLFKNLETSQVEMQ
jgi:tRNA dimethylallyltransferase